MFRDLLRQCFVFPMVEAKPMCVWLFGVLAARAMNSHMFSHPQCTARAVGTFVLPDGASGDRGSQRALGRFH
jgi:hypothetical protein